MAYQISGTVVIDNSQNIVAVGVATAVEFVGKGTIGAGSTCYFFQANAPTGFTKLTSDDDCTLRVVSGTAGSVGGATSFSTVFPSASVRSFPVSQTVGNTTLTTPQLPVHSHPATIGPGGTPRVGGFNPTGGVRSFTNTGLSGSGDNHSHPLSPFNVSIDLRVQYIDVIAATRDA